MANKILVARGTKARIEAIKSSLSTNELVYSTDTGELGVKKADGSIQYFMNAEDVNALVNALDNSKVDKVSGKGLSTNDYTNTDKAKVANLPSSTVFSSEGKIYTSYLPDSVVHSFELKGTLGSLEDLVVSYSLLPSGLEKGWIYIASDSFSIANRLTGLEIPGGEEYDIPRSAWDGWTFCRYEARYQLTTNFLEGDMFIICDINPTEKVIYFGYIDNNASDLYVPLTRKINGLTLTQDRNLWEKTTITIDPEDWIDNQVTKTVSGVTSTSLVWVSPAETSYTDYVEAEIRAIAQGTNSITFQCENVPDVSININIVKEVVSS